MNLSILILWITTVLASTQAQYKTARGWVRNELKPYNLGSDEEAYKNDPPRRFAYLSHVFSALMTVEDVDRSYKILKRLRAWGKHMIINGRGPELMEKSERIHRGFDEFLLKLRSWEATRKDKCPSMQRDLLDLASFDSPPSNSPCLDVKESPSETTVVDSILVEILRENLEEAQRLVNGAITAMSKDRLFKIEMVIILIQQAISGTAPCVPLWEDDWNLLPFQKFTILKTYNNMLRSPPAKTISEAAFHGDFRLDAVRNLFQQTVIGPNAGVLSGILERLGLALGNEAIDKRLSLVSFHQEHVANCRARHTGVIYRTEVQKVPVQQVFREVVQQPRRAATAQVLPARRPVQYVVEEAPVQRQIVVPAPPPPVVRVVEQRVAPEPVVLAPRQVIVEKPCPGPDYRFLVNIGQAYSQALQHFLERHSFSEFENANVRQLRELIHNVERIIAPRSNASLKYE